MNTSTTTPLAPLATSSSSTSANAAEADASFDDEWEEWDGKSPFWHHCVAGSLAGVAEHTLVYPLDTVRTHIQVCAACHYNGQNSASPVTRAVTATTSGSSTSVLQKAASARTLTSATMAATATSASTPLTTSGSHNMTMLQALRQLVSHQPLAALEGGATATAATASPSSTSTAESILHSAASAGGLVRLWRGVQTILIGCIPAHALYFSTYETVKAATLDRNGNVTAYGSALAGAAAVVSHDLILGPLDTVKQRLQLGHYRGLGHALSTMIQNEGAISLVRSFPVTLATNIPYGIVMVGTNEFLKQQWTHNGDDALTLPILMGASSLAGLLASATTTPLDRIKTYLQTQQLTPACLLSSNPGHAPETCPLTGAAGTSSSVGKTAGVARQQHKPLVADWKQAALRIYRTEGTAGFFRGLTPRVLSHTPAVAISWTTYETAKKYLAFHFGTGE